MRRFGEYVVDAASTNRIQKAADSSAAFSFLA